MQSEMRKIKKIKHLMTLTLRERERKRRETDDMTNGWNLTVCGQPEE